MIFAQLFKRIMDLYPSVGNKVDSNSETYDLLCRKLPKLIKDELNKDFYDVTGSMGRGNKTDYPWISILNTRVTTTTQKGIYMVFLFKKDMSGFYLSLNQGITFFDNTYKSKKYAKALSVANYFQNEITDTSFTKNQIDLGGSKGDLGYGYCMTNIISRYYPADSFTNEMIIADLNELSGIYDEIVSHMGNDSYDAVIEKVLDSEDNNLVLLPTAIEMIRQVADPNSEMPRDFIRKVTVVDKPEVSKKYKKITAPSNRKIDYIKKAQNDIKTGLLGEELALEYEKNRLKTLGEIEAVENVRWVSKESDSFGFDIASFDIINGKLEPIRIEVKTTNSPVDVDFYVSRNELEKSKEYKNTYYVYRIYDFNSMSPKMYIAKGEITKNFSLDPVTYLARYKYPMVIDKQSSFLPLAASGSNKNPLYDGNISE